LTPPPRILAIAGSDSSGGAGIQADIKTITMLGGYAMTAITAVTAQNTLGVQAIVPMPGELVLQQLAACIEDIGCDAIKIGMLASEDVVRHVAGGIIAAPEIAARSLLGHSRMNLPPGSERFPIVLDPVMVATSHALLADHQTIEAMRSRLFPLATVLTPNIPEIEVLADMTVRTLDDLRDAAMRLADRHGFHVLAKGGHSTDKHVIDLLVAPGGFTLKAENARLNNTNTHGTGCTLASALATLLGAGLPLATAFERARAFVQEAIHLAPGFGLGTGPLGHQAAVHQQPRS
jgi:hydroxymethylpyrimidine/phosphomethylpyrimidine kinase